MPISRFFSDQPDRSDLCHVPAGNGILVDRIGAVADYRAELLGHLLFDASALHGIDDIGTLPASYLSVVFTFRR